MSLPSTASPTWAAPSASDLGPLGLGMEVPGITRGERRIDHVVGQSDAGLEPLVVTGSVLDGADVPAAENHVRKAEESADRLGLLNVRKFELEDQTVQMVLANHGPSLLWVKGVLAMGTNSRFAPRRAGTTSSSQAVG